MDDLLTGMEISINVHALLVGFLFSIIGFWLFGRGKHRADHRIIVIGILLMIYPYFVDSTKATWAIGLGLCAAAKYLWDR